MPWTREEKIFCVTTYLGKQKNKQKTKQETKKHLFDVSSSKDTFFTGCVPNDRHCTFLSYNSLSYQWVASILRHPV